MTNVHIVAPGFVEPFDENAAGHWDDCGPYANECALAIVQHRAMSAQHMDAIRSRDIGAGLFRPGNGQNVYELVNDVHKFESGVVVKLYPDLVNYDSPDSNSLVDVVKDITCRGNVAVCNLGNAGALPGNQRNVAWHFVTIGGIDSELGYLVANGDEIPFTGKCIWVTRQNLIDAHLVAVVEYQVPQPPPPAPANRYTIETGDTLSGLATKFHTTVGTLAGLNHISDINMIIAGQSIVVP